MTGVLKINFASDMPTIVVDVVAPDLSVVKRMMMSANETETVNVPSEFSFLRIHLPSGRTVTLSDPGNLDRTVALEALRSPSKREPERSDPDSALNLFSGRTESGTSELTSRRARNEQYIALRYSPPAIEYTDELIAFGRFGAAYLQDSLGNKVVGNGTSSSREGFWDLNVDPVSAPYEFGIHVNDGRKMTMRVPANAQRVWVRVDQLSGDQVLLYSVRLESTQPAADTVLTYLRRGDFTAAAAMEKWVDESEDLLRRKMSDPYAAVVAAYLLLRLGRTDVMRDWTRNLAQAFPFLPDGCVLWASQMMKDTDMDGDIREQLLEAMARGLPVYSEGLRLLIDALRLLGRDGQAEHRKLRSMFGEVIWTSPLTAYVNSGDASAGPFAGKIIEFDIDYAPRA